MLGLFGNVHCNVKLLNQFKWNIASIYQHLQVTLKLFTHKRLITAKGLLEKGVKARDLKPPFPIQSTGQVHQDFPGFFITCLMSFHSSRAWFPSTFRSTFCPLPLGRRCAEFLGWWFFSRLNFNSLCLWRPCLPLRLGLWFGFCSLFFPLFLQSLLFLISFLTYLFLASCLLLPIVYVFSLKFDETLSVQCPILSSFAPPKKLFFFNYKWEIYDHW